jgi:polyhydroxyalkanoate synthase
MQPQPQDAFLASITQAGNEVSQGWMRVAAAAPGVAQAVPWLAAIQQGMQQGSSLHASYVEKQSKLWTSLVSGRGADPVAPDPGDRRFAARAWRDNPYFDYLKQSYLLAARFLEELVEGAALEPGSKARARFAVRQWIDALCPANFAATNPEAARLLLQTRGESLARGLANLIGDVHKGRISHTEDGVFEVGRDLALTPGEVVFENELIQLIQYAAATPRVAARPLVMVPPCINKYYVLDLQPDNSFVRYAVERGHTVFMVSWRNVGAEHGRLTWDDYLEQGLFTAFRVARSVAAAERINALGFCVGGTLLGAALAVLAARRDDAVASATFLSTMLDFSETGQIGLFVDEAGVAAREASLGRGGVLPGSDLAFVFSSVRANDLIWPYVVNNYLLGGRPAAFDILYWNSDSTNLPGPMYCYYLRNTYLENKLRVPGALVNCGVPVDLGRVGVPSFVLATREDHIVPWVSAYRTLGLLGGESEFVLGASGHIAGVINPESKKRRSHWIGSAPHPHEPQRWLAGAAEQPGSWWPRWSQWLSRHAGGEREAPRACGNPQFRPIEPAPGRYVKQRAPALPGSA